MMRQWIKILVLVLIVLAQTACPRHAAQQNPDVNVDNPSPTRERGGRGSGLDSAPSGRRVALVIGNSAYATAPLKNTMYDARDMAQTLRDLGFDVLQQENINQNEMKRAIRAFGEKIRQSSVALFYYAGHGIQVNGQNYLVPIGATIDKQEEVEYEGVDVGLVLAQMEDAGSQTNIVILDACRNNPFARRFRSATRGLASMNAPSGTLTNPANTSFTYMVS